MLVQNIVWFLYALWRDVVWDTQTEPLMDSEAAFLYALWRDVVWDPTPSGGLLTSRNMIWLHRCPGEEPNLAVSSRS